MIVCIEGQQYCAAVEKLRRAAGLSRLTSNPSPLAIDSAESDTSGCMCCMVPTAVMIASSFPAGKDAKFDGVFPECSRLMYILRVCRGHLVG